MRDNRLEYNLKILSKMEKFFIDNPHIRFFQGLWILGIIEYNKNEDNLIIFDKFSEESKKIYSNILDNE
jgi:hypothetical protein